MSSLFTRGANSIYWLSIGAIATTIVTLPVVFIAWARSPYATGEQQPAEQPIKFDHRHHVRDDGIDCLYCHGNAESSSYAGVPPTSLCMGCHAQIWTASPELARVRDSYFSGAPIHWQRVNRVPDFVFFDHSIHIHKGVGCVSCHGRVDEMGQVYAAEPLTMRFCLDCHRHPERHLRPLSEITNMDWKPARSQEAIGRELVAELGVRSVTDCTGCHR